MAEHQKHARLVKPSWNDSIPPLYGLVLAGGESRRMGFDKSALDYHGVPQLEYVFTLLNGLLGDVYISRRESKEDGQPVIADTFLDLGPFGGVLSAFRINPNVAWLSVPCDMPLLDRALLEQLIGERDHEKLATCFLDPSTGFPEPLLTIWEPRAYHVLLRKLGEGVSCLRKTLINEDVNIIQAVEPQRLRNANTPEEAEYYRNVLRNSL